MPARTDCKRAFEPHFRVFPAARMRDAQALDVPDPGPRPAPPMPPPAAPPLPRIDARAEGQAGARVHARADVHAEVRIDVRAEPLCILDIEASGFGRNSYPIEIGYVLPDGRARCTLVRPAAHWTHWDETAEALHGIRRGTLLRHGRPAAEVAQALNDDLGGRVVYCDGWAHDYAWLGALFEEAGFSPQFKLETVGRLLDERRLAGLATARAAALDELGLRRHRASNDARVLQRALTALAGA
jgi:DNA polymerase III epsilon subunit-like protein